MIRRIILICHRPLFCELFNIELDKAVIHDIQRAATFSIPLGDNQFTKQIEIALGRKLGHACRGRPTKKKVVSENG
jgi:hypothetical protein